MATGILGEAPQGASGASEAPWDMPKTPSATCLPGDIDPLGPGAAWVSSDRIDLEGDFGDYTLVL